MNPVVCPPRDPDPAARPPVMQLIGIEALLRLLRADSACDRRMRRCARTDSELPAEQSRHRVMKDEEGGIDRWLWPRRR